jgi:hypothetical protein
MSGASLEEERYHEQQQYERRELHFRIALLDKKLEYKLESCQLAQ